VRTFRHAISLDERRAKFRANLWNRPSDREAKLGTDAEASAAAGKIMYGDAEKTPTKERWSWDVKKVVFPVKSFSLESTTSLREGEIEFEALYTKRLDQPTDISEVWFAGCHCGLCLFVFFSSSLNLSFPDVGGGSVANGTRNSLARIALRWMVRECFKTNSGIMFNTERLREIGLDPTTLWPEVLERPPPLPVPKGMRMESPPLRPWIDTFLWLLGRRMLPPADPSTAREPPHSEEEEELQDALSPIYDRLLQNLAWWILEIVPMKHRSQRGDHEWVSWFGFVEVFLSLSPLFCLVLITVCRWNLGRPRTVFWTSSKERIKVHRSVKIRMEAKSTDGKRYKPRARLMSQPVWVD
jgi:hypothetical protein